MSAIKPLFSNKKMLREGIFIFFVYFFIFYEMYEMPKKY